MFKAQPADAFKGTIVSLEVITQLEEDRANMVMESNSASREPLRQAVQALVKLAEKRVEMGETNVRGHMFYCMVSTDHAALQVPQRLKNREIQT